jgi:low affinity Fe/Cu permease
VRYRASEDVTIQGEHKIMSEMVPTGSKYTDEQRIEAATQYAIDGSLTKVADKIGIPRTTINEWAKSEWWVQHIVKVRQQNDDKVLAKAAKIVDLAQQVVLDKLPEATASQAAVIGGIYIDKGRLIRNQPTSIQGKSGDMQALIKKFDELSNKWEEKQVNVVSVQHKDKSST